MFGIFWRSYYRNMNHVFNKYSSDAGSIVIDRGKGPIKLKSCKSTTVLGSNTCRW